MNESYLQIEQRLSLASVNSDDIVVIWSRSLGALAGIKASDFQIGTSSNFEWVFDRDYDFDEVVTFNGLWWQSLIAGIGTNTGNVPAEGLNWTQINKISGVIIPLWTPGLVTDHLTLFREGNLIYGLKDTVTLPFDSQTTPSADPTNWEPITSKLQDAYNASTTNPQILTNSTKGAFKVRRGSGLDTDNIYEGQNGAGTITFSITGGGVFTVSGIATAGRYQSSLDGLLSNTAFGWSSDTSMGLIRNGAGDFSIVNNAIETMNFDPSNNVTIPNGTLTVSSDTDVTTILGRTKIHSITADGTYFSHFDQDGATEYALFQDANGFVRLNASSTRFISFRIASVEQWQLSSTGNLVAATGRNLDLTSTSSIRIGSIDTITFTGTQDVTIPAGSLSLTLLPSTGDVNPDQILVRDSVNGELKVIAASGGGSTNFLRADGTWAAPPAGGSSAGDNNEIQTSDGAGSFTSDKVFANAGNITLGDSGLGGNRTILVSSLDASADLILKTDGSGEVLIRKGANNGGVLKVGDNTDAVVSRFQVNSKKSATLILADILADGVSGEIYLDLRGATADTWIRIGEGSNYYALGLDRSDSSQFKIGVGGSDVTPSNLTEVIGISTSGNLGLFGATPVTQASHIADPTGGATVDAEARTAIDGILAQLAGIGIQGSS